MSSIISTDIPPSLTLSWTELCASHELGVCHALLQHYFHCQLLLASCCSRDFVKHVSHFKVCLSIVVMHVNCRIWNTGGHKIKLIGIAQKRAAPEAQLSSVNDANTGDRNAVSSVDSARDMLKDAAAANENGNGAQAEEHQGNASNGNGNGAAGCDAQLDIKVGTLNLTAPGTLRDNDDESETDSDGYHQ